VRWLDRQVVQRGGNECRRNPFGLKLEKIFHPANSAADRHFDPWDFSK
jgi:hypothetical protein